MAIGRIVRETAITAGASWSEIAGRDIPDHQIARILTFLGSSARDDIVHTRYYGQNTALSAMDDIVERLVLVGSDGGGRRLRRNRFETTVEELEQDFDAIYLCEAADENAGSPHSYVIIDIHSSGEEDSPSPQKAVLMCKREDFRAVYLTLGIGGSGGSLWRGAALEDAESVRALDESEYVFDPKVVDILVRETCDFLSGEVAARLKEWGVPAKHGILLYGPPGNGKTVLTRLCAKRVLESNMNVVIVEGRSRSARAFDRDLMGIGDQLRRAAARGPALLILEDIDLHCGRRPSGVVVDGAAAEAENRTLAEVLDFLDGFDRTDGYVLLASTNYIERLDPALRRAGRIDRAIAVDAPAVAERVSALERAIALGPKPAPDPSRAAGLLEGASFADLAEVARRYKVVAAGEPESVPQGLFDQAADELLRERNQLTTQSAVDDASQ
jgi:hypothetical protein